MVVVDVGVAAVRTDDAGGNDARPFQLAGGDAVALGVDGSEFAPRSTSVVKVSTRPLAGSAIRRPAWRDNMRGDGVFSTRKPPARARRPRARRMRRAR